MWKVAVEDSDSADSLPAWWDWLVLRSQGSVDFPAGHLPSQTAHLFTAHQHCPRAFFSIFQAACCSSEEDTTDLETKGPLQGQGWLLPAKETPAELQTVPFCQSPLPWLSFLVSVTSQRHCPSVKVSGSPLKSQYTEYLCHRKVRQRLLRIFSKQLEILRWYDIYSGVKARRINIR